ncbi:MAG: tetratricopeptide repeat protein [Acidobacteria bacterium]|nr:tetratricopeptide repeat protein [Acidobacteriota bacterium]
MGQAARIARVKLALALFLATVLAVAATGCATRVPVVTTPAFPDFIYPGPPAAYASSPLAALQRDAWAFLQSGDLDRAEERFSTLLEEDEAFFPASAGLGWVLLARGQGGEALGQFDAALNRSSGYVPALVGRGEALLATGVLSAALASFEAAAAADPGLERIVRVAGELRLRVMTERLADARSAMEQGRFEDAVSAYADVIAASPDSGFLYVERARAMAQAGDADAALEEVRRASGLDPNDVEAIRLEGGLLETLGDLDGALDAFRRAEAIAPDPATADSLARLIAALRREGLPREYSAIAGNTRVTRGDLAALVGVELADLLDAAATGRATPILIDTRNHWANRWIVTAAQAGVILPEAGNRFDPERNIRRGDLAEVAGAVLTLIADIDPVAASAWEGERPRFRDMGTGHLNYDGAARAVAAGVLSTIEGDRFEPTRPVGGADAVDAIRRLGRLAAAAGAAP